MDFEVLTSQNVKELDSELTYKRGQHSPNTGLTQSFLIYKTVVTFQL